MRAHGVANFPDPTPGHLMQFNLASGLNPASPAFRSAHKACQSLIPHPTVGGGGTSASENAVALQHAQCMRSQGVPNYPDPTYKDGRPTVEPLSNYGVNTESPAFLSAAKTCGGE
jgi:hypothetical protein